MHPNHTPEPYTRTIDTSPGPNPNQVHNIVTAEEAAHLIDIGTPRYTRSSTARAGSDEYRTSESAMLPVRSLQPTCNLVRAACSPVRAPCNSTSTLRAQPATLRVQPAALCVQPATPCLPGLGCGGGRAAVAHGRAGGLPRGGARAAAGSLTTALTLTLTPTPTPTRNP
jgi:hypothetical protein